MVWPQAMTMSPAVVSASVAISVPLLSPDPDVRCRFA